MNKFLKYYFPVLILVGIVLYFSFNLNRSKNLQETTNKTENAATNQEEEKIFKNAGENKKKSQETIPDKIFIKVPFTPQAPYAIWDEYHEEACEETSIIMLEYYLTSKKLTSAVAEKEIQDLIKFQIKNYGDYKDTNAEETVELAKDFYGINNLKIIYDFPAQDIKKYLSQGKPVIVPTAGRKLNNPYYTPPGPLYHNLVLVGYDGDTIITNDAGTKRGEGYRYDIKTLYNAIHDFPGRPEDIEKGRKAMIVME